jgi:DNA-binding XRE family transcriptional regulator
LAQKSLQRDVAERIDVDKASVYNWEAGDSAPRLEYMPAIIRFLVYVPLPAAT